MSFQLSGNTNSVSLPDALQILQRARVSGVLIVRKSSTEKRLHFKNGQIIFATSNDERDRLGEMLVKAGMLSRENLEKAIALYQKNAGLKKIGAIMVENGFISPKNLFGGLKIQVKEIIYSLFLWDDAEYEFKEQDSTDVIQLSLNMQELITEIIDRIRQES